VEKLREFLRELHEAADGRWRVAVEFRNATWLDDDVYRVLDEAGAAICLHDMHPFAATERENDAKFIYIRRHGFGAGKYAGSYPPEKIAADADRVRKWASEGKDVFVYYNNDIDGWAVANARELIEKVGEG
jgi:uncharacterized protein YecE (DUF72 family)